jgi:hypothetical protein
MGVNQLPSLLRSSNDLKNTLKELAGKTIGVDVSVGLHKLFARSEFIRDFHLMPPISLKFHVARFFSELNDIFLAARVTPIFYLDGAYHPNKAAENDRRRKRIDSNRDKFLDLQRNGDPMDIPEILECMKASCYLREDVVFSLRDWCQRNRVTLIGAPFEADPQVVYEEITHKTNASLTTDSDLFILGSEVMVDNLVYSKLGRCNIIRRAEALKSPMLGGGNWDMAAFAAFLGCDFIKRPLGQGLQTVSRDIMPAWMDGDESKKAAILQNIASTRQWSLGEPAEDYPVKFGTARNMYVYPPVFRQTDSLSEPVSLSPLHDLPVDRSFTDLIGFDPQTVLKAVIREADLGEHLSPDIMRDMYELKIWSRTGRDVADIPMQIDATTDKTLPYGAVLDFIACPAQMHSDKTLQKWLTLRRLKFFSSPDQDKASVRSALVNMVKRVHAMGPKGPPVAEDVQIGDGQYVIWDVLKSDNKVEWMGAVENSGMELLSMLRDHIVKIDDTVIDETFGVGKPGIRQRAQRCVAGGHINLSTMKFTRVKQKVRGTGVILLTVQITPSVKASLYWTSLVFDEQSGNLLTTPFSGCDCPVGNLFCSHMLGLMLLIMMLQSNKLNINELLRYLPPPVMSLQNLPVYAAFVY